MRRRSTTLSCTLLLSCAVLLSLVRKAQATCHDHHPCCVCLENVCGKSRGSLSECEACTVRNISLMTGHICNCVEADFNPWCRTTSWGCECNAPTDCKCMPSVSGRYPSEADCQFDGCGSGKPPPPPGPRSPLRVAAIFADDMVLQAENATIHGTAPPGSSVIVMAPARPGFPISIVAGVNGDWAASLGSQPACSSAAKPGCKAEPTTITVTANGPTIRANLTLERVLFGDVFLCGGQSNMLIPTSYILLNQSTIAAAVAHRSAIRVMSVDPGLQTTTPQDNVGPLTIPWSVPTPEIAGRFSAVCLTTALGLIEQDPAYFAHRPLGLVANAAAGTPVEAWMPADSAAKCPAVPTDAGCELTGNLTSGLYNGQIHPFRRMAFKLAIFYQGESNALWGQFPRDSHTSDYTCRYKELISGWRDALNFVGPRGWLTVQIAPWLGPRTSAIFQSVRLSQDAVGQLLPAVGTIVTHDLGDPLNPPPYSSMHPRNKTVVGNRLAAAALALGFVGSSSILVESQSDSTSKTAQWGGPAFESITRVSDTSFTIVLARAAGLRLVGADMCDAAALDDAGKTRPESMRCCAAPDTFQLWENIAATETKTLPGDAPPTSLACKVNTDEGSLHCTSETSISAGSVVTAAWQNFPHCILMNARQLPASTMRANIPELGESDGQRLGLE